MYIDIRIILLSLLFIICCYSSNTKVKEGFRASNEVISACQVLKEKNGEECGYDSECGIGDSNYWGDNCKFNYYKLSRTCHNSDKYNTQCRGVPNFVFLEDN